MIRKKYAAAILVLLEMHSQACDFFDTTRNQIPEHPEDIDRFVDQLSSKHDLDAIVKKSY